jgi:hypothetical protein
METEKPKLNFWIAMTDKPMRMRLMPPGVCNYCDQNRGTSMFPSHDASPNCESGKWPHCTCDVCF